MMYHANQYQIDKEYRRRQMRYVLNNELATLAKTEQVSPVRTGSGRKVWLLISLSLGLALIAWMLLVPQTTRAQDLSDPGQSEPFAEAMTTYRVAHYYFVEQDYTRAVSEYLSVLEAIPQVVMEAKVGYEVIYWELGEAQFMAGQHADALYSYTQYLILAGDAASADAIAYVQQLEVAVNSGVASGMTLINS